MPKDHARKKALADLKESLGIKHACAIALLDHGDPDETQQLIEYLETYVDINTYREAVDYLRQEQNDPANQVLCERCGWLNKHVCPECEKGCGCERECSGWRHEEMAYDEPDDEYDDPDRNVYCRECGAGSSSPYDECTCFEDDDSEERQQETVPAPSPEPRELAYPGGWGSSSGPFPNSGWSS
jgi:hypothetical protein